MKKLIMMLIIVIYSTSFALADGTTCRVYGSSDGNVATINNPYVCSSPNNAGKFVAEVTVTLTKIAEETTSVVVKLYDGNNRVAATEVVKIQKGCSSSYATFYRPNKECYEARIADATCQ